jgi:hypothetical protein
MIEETFAYGLVIGCSLFGILWGLVNALLVSFTSSLSPSLLLQDQFLNLVSFRSDKLIWKIIPILEAKKETTRRDLSSTKATPPNPKTQEPSLKK